MKVIETLKFDIHLCKSALVKVGLLGIVGICFLVEYIRSDQAADDPWFVHAFIGLVAVTWLAFGTILAIVSYRSRKEEILERSGAANRTPPIRSVTNETSSPVGSRR